MATTPSTIVVFTHDSIHFPAKVGLVVMQQLFQYDVKGMFIRGEKIFISLSYSPRSITLKRKFGNLPVKYMRTKLEKAGDFKILENVVRKYKFNLLDDLLKDVDRVSVEAPGYSGKKRKLFLEAPTIQNSTNDDDDVEERVSATLPPPPPPTRRNDNEFSDTLPQAFQ